MSQVELLKKRQLDRELAWATIMAYMAAAEAMNEPQSLQIGSEYAFSLINQYRIEVQNDKNVPLLDQRVLQTVANHTSSASLPKADRVALNYTLNNLTALETPPTRIPIINAQQVTTAVNNLTIRAENLVNSAQSVMQKKTGQALRFLENAASKFNHKPVIGANAPEPITNTPPLLTPAKTMATPKSPAVSVDEFAMTLEELELAQNHLNLGILANSLPTSTATLDAKLKPMPTTPTPAIKPPDQKNIIITLPPSQYETAPLATTITQATPTTEVVVQTPEYIYKPVILSPNQPGPFL